MSNTNGASSLHHPHRIRCTPLALALTLVLGSQFARAEDPPAAEATTALERIVVTGSNIRRTDKETPSPV